MSEINDEIVHKSYFEELMSFFSQSFIDNVDSKRRTKVLEERREERIRIFYNTVIPSLLTRCSNSAYRCLFEECKITNICFPTEVGLARHFLRRHKNKIPACGNFFMVNNYSLKYNIICEHCRELKVDIDETIVLSGSSVTMPSSSLSLSSPSTAFEETKISLVCHKLAIKYTDDWHTLAEAKTWSQPFDFYYSSDDNHDSIMSWSTVCSLKRNITIESFLVSKKKKNKNSLKPTILTLIY